MKYNNRRQKKGAASFYLVAFSTLILLIIAASFAAIVISQMTRTSNDDLSQSAYDSALAGIEDGKLAYYNYQNCLANDGQDKEKCSMVKESFEENPDCNMVAKTLGRLSDSEINDNKPVIIEETKGTSTVSNNMQQAYTCVIIDTTPPDYRTTLTSGNPIDVTRVKFDNVENSQIEKIKISWSPKPMTRDFYFSNYDNNNIVYRSAVGGTRMATPPTIWLGLIQTAGAREEKFTLEDFKFTVGDRTNRGMLYLTPVSKYFSGDDKGEAAKANASGQNYIGAYNGTENYINKNGFLKSNNKVNRNLPYGVYCPSHQDNDFSCSVTVELPKPVGGDRSNETFMIITGLPYGTPDVDISLEFYCADNDPCNTNTIAVQDGSEQKNRANLKNVQIAIDSTGKANDLYRRVAARLEAIDDFSLTVMGPLELLGDDEVLNKNFTVTCEWNFPKNRGC